LVVVREPLEFGHNFLYVTCALFESLLFTKLTEPRMWFTLGTIAVRAAGFSLYRISVSSVPARATAPDRPVNGYLPMSAVTNAGMSFSSCPTFFALNLICASCTYLSQNFFLTRNGHVWLIAFQLLGLAGYLFYSVRFMSTSRR